MIPPLRPRSVKDWTSKVLISSFAASQGRHRAASTALISTASSWSFFAAASLGSFGTTRRMMSSLSLSNADSPESASSSSSSIRRIAVGQLRCTEDKWSNLVQVARCAGEAKRQGACMLFLPENAGFVGSSAAETVLNADPPIAASSNSTAASGPTSPAKNSDEVADALRHVVENCARDGLVRAKKAMGVPPCPDPSGGRDLLILDGLQTIARESGLWLTGTIHVGGGPPAPESPESGASSSSRVYNTHVVLSSTGELVAEYRKIHLFDVNLPGRVTLQESASTAPGHRAVVCDSPIGRLGLSTCYDVRFPELYAALVEKGAQFLLVPSAFTVPTGKAHWHVLLRARAIESQCYVIAAAQVGRHNSKRHSYGHSVVIDPWGAVLVDAGGEDSTSQGMSDDAVADEDDDFAPKVVCCDVDTTLVASIREKMPVQSHRSSAQWE